MGRGAMDPTTRLMAETRRTCDENARHPQVEVSGPEGPVQVDEAMAPLLEALWSKGIGTLFSCQGGGERDAYLTFDGPTSAARFMRLAIAAGETDVAETYVGPDLGNWASTGAPEQSETRRAARRSRSWRSSAGVVPFEDTYLTSSKVTFRFDCGRLGAFTSLVRNGELRTLSAEDELTVDRAETTWRAIIERDREEIAARLSEHSRIGVVYGSGQLMRLGD